MNIMNKERKKREGGLLRYITHSLKRSMSSWTDKQQQKYTCYELTTEPLVCMGMVVDLDLGLFRWLAIRYSSAVCFSTAFVNLLSAAVTPSENFCSICISTSIRGLAMEEVEEEEDEEELDDADGAGLVLCTTDLFEEEMATGTSGNTGIELKSGKLVSSSPRISSRIFLSQSHSFLGLNHSICCSVVKKQLLDIY